MTSKKLELGEQLLQRGRSPQSNASNVVILPMNEMPMILTLDQLRPNPDNPRTTRNPRHDDIKASILARGLDSVPKVTKNPDSNEDVYIFSDGGNTRYTILTELWAETQDERFHRIQCIFKPWPGRLKCVIGHLAENEVRGDLAFIEKAFGIENAKLICQEQLEREVSQRELVLLLKSEGYPVSQSNVSRMEYTVKHLYPYIPVLLNSGMGRPQVMQLIALRTAAEKAWHEFSLNLENPPLQTFDEVFGSVCQLHDKPDNYSVEILKDELISWLLKELPNPNITYDRWLIELDPQEQNRRKLFGEPTPLPQHVIDADKEPDQVPLVSKNDTPISHRSPRPSSGDEKGNTAVPPLTSPLSVSDHAEEQPDLYEPSEKSTLTTELPPNELTPEDPAFSSCDVSSAIDADSSILFANTGLEPVTDIWHIAALQDDIEHLQDIAFRLAFELAEVMGCDEYLQEDKERLGAGYTVQVFPSLSEPGIQLLMALCGESGQPSGMTYGSLSALGTFITGSAKPCDQPQFDDVFTVKFLRLVRVMRRLRELQRKEQ